MPYEITQCYLPPGRGDFLAFTPPKLVLDLAKLKIGQWVTCGLYGSRDMDGSHIWVTSSPWAVKLSWQHSYITIFYDDL